MTQSFTVYFEPLILEKPIQKMDKGSVSKRQKYLYIVDYWVEFPASEYGGCVLVIAADDEDCFSVIRECGNSKELHTAQRVENCRKNIADALRFELKEDLPSKVVSKFIT